MQKINVSFEEFTKVYNTPLHELGNVRPITKELYNTAKLNHENKTFKSWKVERATGTIYYLLADRNTRVEEKKTSVLMRGIARKSKNDNPNYYRFILKSTSVPGDQTLTADNKSILVGIDECPEYLVEVGENLIRKTKIYLLMDQYEKIAGETTYENESIGAYCYHSDSEVYWGAFPEILTKEEYITELEDKKEENNSIIDEGEAAYKNLLMSLATKGDRDALDKLHEIYK